MELDVTLPSAEVSHSMFTFGPTINIETSIGLVCCIMAGNAVSLLTNFMLRNKKTTTQENMMDSMTYIL